jgi:signal transduction histidine kinase/CheY-like chemotaxis protein
MPASYPRRPLVWITDDSPLEATYTERALGPDYEFEHFSDGSQVVERLVAGGRQPDVLLLDWVMPAMTGDEVCRFLRSHPPTATLPIIIVTASRIETADVVEGLGLGANDYVPRPFVPEELRARVDTAIRAKRLREQTAREQARLATVARLGRAFVGAEPRVENVIEALATALVGGVCDGCAIVVLPGGDRGITLARHRIREHDHLLAGFSATDPCTYEFASADEARGRLPPAYHEVIDRLGLSALTVIPFPGRGTLTGVLTAMRDGHSEPFEPDDLTTLETCVEYAAIAAENALRFGAERSTRAQLETILEQLPVAIVVAEPSGLVTRANPSALDVVPELREIQSLAELNGRIAIRSAGGGELELAQWPVTRALAGETVHAMDLELGIGDELPRVLRCSAVPLRDAHGSVAAAITVFADITAERAVALERERTVEFQRYVLGIVGHDLRTPVQTIAMGCEGIRGSTEEPAVLALVDRIDATNRRIKGLIEQLLDVTRAQLGGGIPIRRTETDLQTVIESVLSELALAYPDVDLQTELHHVRGQWDGERLAQVATNLINNAIQHGARGMPVWIETGRDGGDAVLVVRNAVRAPLTQDQVARMFAPFRTASRGARSSGLGLGLYIVSEILRGHGGGIHVESDAQVTSFTVRIPIRPSDAPDAGPSTRQLPA